MAATDKTRIAKPSPIKENEQGQLVAKKGISREVIAELSKIKGEPDWMREKRIKSYEIFERKPIPTWGVDLSDLDLSELVLYSPPEAGRYDSWDDVPEEQKDTFEKLGIPQAEREHLAGVVGVWRQEPFYEGLKQEYADQGIIFCAMDTAVIEHEDIVREYFMNKCVPPQDNKFSALHGAVWSGGSFLYVPKDVKVDLPLQAYFRMEGANEGTFEHTLIIADEGSEVNYIEGCTAQTYSVNSMHSAVVEIFVKEGAKARYTTVQNWSKDVFNLNTKRAIVEAHGTVEWVGGSMGAKKVMLYPGSFLIGEGARADHLNVGVASGDVWKDTGAKVVHLAPNTNSNILAKSISKDGGIMGYRGLVRMGHNSQGSKARVQCDGLMMDDRSRSDTWPDIQIQNPHVTVAHEAVVGKISDEQLFYLQSRGLSEEEAAAMIVNGFIEPVTKELPMEYAVELNRLIQLEMVDRSADPAASSARPRHRASAYSVSLRPCFLASRAPRRLSSIERRQDQLEGYSRLSSSSGNGGWASGRTARRMSISGLSSPAMRFTCTVAQSLQRCTSAHSPSARTHTPIGSIDAPQSAARSPGELASTCLLQRQVGQWFRCSVPGASIETSSRQLRQRKLVWFRRRARLR